MTNPSGITTGDRLLLVAFMDSGDGIAALADWTEVDRATASALSRIVAARTADETEGATTTISRAGVTNREFVGWIYRISGYNTLETYHTYTSQNNGALTTHPFGTQATTTADEALVLSFLGFDGEDGDPFSVSTGGGTYTIIDTIEAGSGGTGVGATYMTSSQPTAGTLDPLEVDSSSSDGSHALQISFVPPQVTEIAVGTAAEENTAETVGLTLGEVAILIGVATEENTAETLALTLGEVALLVAAASEENMAEMIALATGPATIAIGGAAEEDSAGSIGLVVGAATIAVTPAAEEDTAEPVTTTLGAVSIPVNGAVENNQAEPLAVTAGAVAVTVGAPAEENTAEPIAFAAAVALAVAAAAEVDTAEALTRVTGAVSVAVGPAAEMDSATALTLLVGFLGTLPVATLSSGGGHGVTLGSGAAGVTLDSGTTGSSSNTGKTGAE